MANPKRAQSVERAVRLLAEMAAAPGPVRLSDLSTGLGMSKSSVHLLLATLADAGLVEQTQQATYRLGLGLFELGTAALQQYGLGARLSPILESLAEETGEAVTLGVLHQGGVLLVQRFESDHVLRASIRVGTRMPPHTSASGRAILAFLPEQERTRLLRDAGVAAAGMRRVNTRVRHIRDQGYETQRDEWSAGIASIAAAVFDVANQPAAALSISTPTTRFDPEKWAPALLRTADRLTALLRHMALDSSQLAVLAR